MDGLRKFSVEFELDHFMELTVEADSGEYRCRCLNTKDGLLELLEAVLLLQSYERTQSALKWPYSGQTWWVFDRDGPDVSVSCLEFDETPLALPTGHWIAIEVFRRIGVSFSTPLCQFVSAMIHELEAARARLGDQGFRSAWGYDFPLRQIESLRLFAASLD
jgi:hypothetical protein